MQKFAPSASRLPQDGQKFRGGAAARDTDDATTDAVTGSAVGGVTRTPSSGCDGEAGSPPAPQPNQPRAAGAGGAWGATGAGGVEGAVTGAAAGGAAAGGSAADAARAGAGAPVDATS